MILSSVYKLYWQKGRAGGKETGDKNQIGFDK